MLEQLIVNYNVNAVRHAMLEGREHLVVPMVMLTEGVHAGSNGPLFYPGDELSKSVQVWNHKPIVVYHPQMNGQGISACDPIVINSSKVGIILNTKWDRNKKKLRAEAWLEKGRLSIVDDRVLDHLEKKQMMEVSTGLYTENEEKEGAHLGKKYVAIAKNYRPDHLALLPDMKGACSIEDGAGLLQLNAADQSKVIQAVQAALKEKFKSPVRILNLGDDSVVFHDATRLLQVGYSVSDDVVTLNSDDPKEVKQVFQAVGTATTPEEKKMARKEQVDKLISNGRWEETDRDFLTKMEEKQFDRIVKNDEAVVKAEKDAEEVKKNVKTPEEIAQLNKQGVDDATKKGASGVQPTTNDDKKEPTVDEFINNAPQEMRGVLRHGIAAYNQERETLIKTITENKANKFTTEYLKTKEVEELRGIAALAAAATPTAPAAPPVSFFGSAVPVLTDNVTSEEEPLLPPTMNFQKKEAAKV